MTKTKRSYVTVATRVSPKIVEKIDQVRREIAEKTPGVIVRRSDAIRMLLESAIAMREGESVS